MQNDSQDERYQDNPDGGVDNHPAGDSNEITPGNQTENNELSGTSEDDSPDIEAAISQRLEGIDLFSDKPGDEDEKPESTVDKQDSPGDNTENGLSDFIEDEPTYDEKPSDEMDEISRDTTISDRLSDLRKLIGEPEADDRGKIPEADTADETHVIETGVEAGDIETTLSEDKVAETIDEYVSLEFSGSEDADLRVNGTKEEVPQEILEAIRELDLDEEQLAAMDEIRKEMIDELMAATPSDTQQVGQIEISSVDIDEYGEEGRSRFRFTKRTLLWIVLIVLIAASVMLIRVLMRELRPATPTPDTTPIVLELPDDVSEGKSVHPVGLEFLGGWYFKLETGYVINGIWEPQSAEWLQSTQLRRIIALPWSEQLDAVVSALEPGTAMKLTMSNDDTIIYYVQDIEKVPRTQVDAFSGNTPALVIIVFQPDSDERIVITCAP